MTPSSPSDDEQELPSPGSGNLSQVTPSDPRLQDPTHDSSFNSSVASENTVIDTEQRTELYPTTTTTVEESWSNTFESNQTDTSVDEPKYAKVTHRKRGSKLYSGQSTPKAKRNMPQEPLLSR